jgi:hypothetical protein
MDTRMRGDIGNSIAINMSKTGFGPVAPTDRAWRGCYFSSSLRCYVIVYVDDFEIAGPPENVKLAWDLIRGPNPKTGERGFVRDDLTPAGEFLGCNHVCSEEWGPPMSGDQLSVQPLCSQAADEQEGARTPPNGSEAIEQTGGSPPSANGLVKYKQIRCNMSPFLGFRVRLCQDLARACRVPLKTALTPFVDETGDDCGLGAGGCADAKDGADAKDACVDIAKTLQDLAQNAMAGIEHSGLHIWL